MNNLVGFVFIVYDNNNQKIYYKMFKINNEATLFMAEMVAIRKALNYAINYFENYILFWVTDSLSFINY